jgi:hypothetical protein
MLQYARLQRHHRIVIVLIHVLRLFLVVRLQALHFRMRNVGRLALLA